MAKDDDSRERRRGAGGGREETEQAAWLFALAAEGAAVWCDELEEEITKLEEFYTHEGAQMIAIRSGVDKTEIAANAQKTFRELRCAIAEAITARREVLDEDQRGAST